MRCGTFLYKRLNSYRPEGGDLAGAAVAAESLIHATLAIDAALAWDIWLRDRGALAENRGRAQGADGTRMNGGRIIVRELNELPALARRDDYALVAPLPLVSALAEWRATDATIRAPICGILHAANLPDFGWAYLRIALSLDPADVLVATSRAGEDLLRDMLNNLRDWIAERTGGRSEQISLPAIHRIPLGTTLPLPAVINRGHARHVLNIPPTAFTLLYIGRLTETYKADLDVLLMAAARVADRRPNICLILAGQAPEPAYLTYIRRRTGEYGLSERVVILENFPEYIKSTLFAAADVFVSPADSIQETFGLAIIEAMAHSLPVVATDWSGYRDLVRDGHTGFTIKTSWSPETVESISSVAPLLHAFDIAHQIAQATICDCEALAAVLLRLCNNPDLGRALGDNGRRIVEFEYASDVVGRRFAELWRDQVAASRQQGRRPTPLHDYQRFFARYSSGTIRETSLVARSEFAMRTPMPPRIHSTSAAGADEVLRLLDLCTSRPQTVGDLRRSGVSLTGILWAAKKGLCRIHDSAPGTNGKE